jgi:hypothetical protein
MQKKKGGGKAFAEEVQRRVSCICYFRLREGMGRWRSMMYVKHRSIGEWADRQKEGFMGEGEENKERKMQEEEALGLIYRRNRRLRMIMVAWMEYVWKKRSRDRRIRECVKIIKKRRLRDSIEKWRKRKQATNRLNVIIKNFKRRRMNRVKKNIFQELYAYKERTKTLFDKL